MVAVLHGMVAFFAGGNPADLDAEEEGVVFASPEERLLLARLIQAEAEKEPKEGKIAVGAVVLNRLRHASYPNTIAQVIMQPGQFESVSNGRLYSIITPNKECMEAAGEALSGRDPSRGSLFFFNPQKSDSQWMKQKELKVTLGEHLFMV